MSNKKIDLDKLHQKMTAPKSDKKAIKLQKDANEAIFKCTQEIKDICNKYNCLLQLVFTVKANMPEHRVDVIYKIPQSGLTKANAVLPPDQQAIGNVTPAPQSAQK